MDLNADGSLIMAFDEATAITRLPALTQAQTALIQPMLDTAMALAETYCNRKFDYANEVESMPQPVLRKSLSLRRYPLESVTSIVQAHGAVDITEWHLDKDSGLVHLHGWHGSHEMTVTYKGGYSVLPFDLELALWQIFHGLWASTPGAGTSLGSSGGALDGIKSIALPDVGTLSFFEGGSATASSGRGGAMGGAIPALAAGILDLYRRELV